ncbi:Cu(I)-responsive transcriptional regulator [Pusillimonas sp. DMV24BSW_D]|uniref:Cu(I)-responsive transcriptional regulator n=1 Tax=Neopusillimonas aestuarii TaxID=2716226 RepID=UPI00140DF76A|nr:Cu(I)-responsive transcriptional regulator [Pusillimonas sp. DMV24BSW_D]QIM49756.1 Cu(I)-responsive transcriptional regulator [Pusillimonas sp. DMV24BSW_D]
MNIGAAAKQSGISAKMIRYYEQVGLLQPPDRSDSGYRLYGPTDVQTLIFIRRARDLGFSLERIQTLLELWRNRNRRSEDVKALAQGYIQELDTDIARLVSIRNELERLAQCCGGDGSPECPILEDLAQPPAQIKQ